MANEPAIRHDHRRVDEAGNECEADHAEVDDHETGVAIHPGEQDVTNAGEKNRRYNDRPWAVTIDKIADQRRFYGALRARQRKRQRRCRPANSEILADREKENREAEL